VSDPAQITKRNASCIFLGFVDGEIVVVDQAEVRDQIVAEVGS
jgi:hypothetical protein